MSVSNPVEQPTLAQRWKLFPRSSEAAAPTVRQVIGELEPKHLTWQRLTPASTENARPNTLSSRYGLGVFPLHTDYVDRVVPPRYVLLVAARPRSAGTIVFDAHLLISEFGSTHLERSLFIQRGRNPRYTRLLTYVGTQSLFRFNAALMSPVNREAETVAAYLERGAKTTTRIDWLETGIALIDNWNALHAREAFRTFNGVGLRRFAVWGGINDLGG
jgi:hypothetical protein